jgi:hypothetical protein
LIADETTPHPFIGREALLDEIKRHLLKGQHVALYGDRGIGKTAVVERIVQWLREERPQVRFVHVADEMTFKDLLVVLARELHALKLFRHPLIPDEEIREIEWPQISKKTKALALRELAAAIVTSLRGEGVLLILDSLNRVKPTDQAWLEEFINNSVCLIATRDKDEKNLKPLLLRFQAIEVPPLKKREAYELMETLMEEKPVPSVDPAFFQRSVWEASRGYPSAIRDLIWKGSLEKYVDREQIRAIHHEAGVKGFSIAPIVVILTAALAIWRYVARGVGDQDGLIIGGAGVVVFMVIQFFMRKAR